MSDSEMDNETGRHKQTSWHANTLVDRKIHIERCNRKSNNLTVGQTDWLTDRSSQSVKNSTVTSAVNQLCHYNVIVSTLQPLEGQRPWIVQRRPFKRYLANDIQLPVSEYLPSLLINKQTGPAVFYPATVNLSLLSQISQQTRNYKTVHCLCLLRLWNGAYFFDFLASGSEM